MDCLLLTVTLQLISKTAFKFLCYKVYFFSGERLLKIISLALKHLGHVLR